MSFSNLSGEPSLQPVSNQRKEMKFGQPCQLPLWKKWYDGINEEVSVEENDVLLEFLHPIDPSVYLHWSSIDIKCWVPVNHVLQLLSILTVHTAGCPYTFLKNEFKDTLTGRNLFFSFKQFDHHWKLLKTLDFNTYQSFLFLFFIVVVISMNVFSDDTPWNFFFFF